MSEKSVLFLHEFGPQFASYRYRAETPAKQLTGTNGFKIGLNEEGDYDVIVVSKPSENALAVALKARSDGAKVIADMSDDHFNDSGKDTYYALAELSDHIVVASEVMRGRIQRYLDRDATVIGDPYEQPESPPHASDGDDFLWFGHQSNFKDLVPVLGLFKNRNLRVLTGPKSIPHTTMWTPNNMIEAFKHSNVVVFPASAGTEYKSANRLINTIRAGCFPVCMHHPAYLEFRRFVWVGEFYTGLRWATAFRQDLNDCVAAAQDYVREKYSPETIGKQWADMLECV